MRNTSPRVSNARSRRVKTTEARSVSVPRGSRPARCSRTSTTRSNAASNGTRSRISAPSTSSRSGPTLCSSDRPAPARPTSRPASVSTPAKPATASRFATAAEWVARLADTHAQGRLQAELTRLGRVPLLIIDEVGYIPFEADAANLFFQLVSSRYERASLIVTSNKPFGRWGEVFGDPVVAAAMIDRLVHHADVISLKGDSYRLKDRDLGRTPNDDAT